MQYQKNTNHLLRHTSPSLAVDTSSSQAAYIFGYSCQDPDYPYQRVDMFRSTHSRFYRTPKLAMLLAFDHPYTTMATELYLLYQIRGIIKPLAIEDAW
jgi:hypothetical protein